MLRLLPWQDGKAFVLLRFLAVLALTEFVRNALYIPFLTLYGPRHLGLSGFEVGVAVSLTFWGETVGRSLGGHLSERLGVGRVSLIGAVVGLVAVSLIPRITSAGWLWALAFAHGVSLSPLWPGIMTLSSRLARPGEASRALGFTQMPVMPFIGLGFLLGATLVNYSPPLTREVLFWTQLVIVLIALSTVRITDGHGNKPPATVGQSAPYPWRRLLNLFPVAFIQTLAPAMVGLAILPFARDTGLSILQLTLLIGTGGAVAFAALHAAGRLADRVGPKWLLVTGLSLQGAALFGLASGLPLWGMLVAAVAAGLGYALMIPSWNGLVVRLLPEHSRASAWGVLMMFEGLGFSIGPAVSGLVSDLAGPAGPFRVSALLLFAVAIFYAGYLKGPVS